MSIKQDYIRYTAGMVTMYNSAPSLVNNVRSYVDQLGKLYIIDNSEVPNEELIRALKELSNRIEYISNNGNKGLGVALNRAADRAHADNYTHLLMMDDDSSMADGTIRTLYSIATSEGWEKIGIVSARQIDNRRSKRSVSKQPDPVSVVQTAITSGSLLSLAAYQCAGPFQEDLFIDWVDIEYSFRLKKYNFQLLLANQATINHRIGLMKETKLLGVLTYRWRSHSPQRLYYKFRNSLYVIRRDRDNIPEDFIRRFRKELFRNVFRILIAEQDKKLFFVLLSKAVSDAKNGRLGKLVS